jgi:hypothetical protein
MKWAIGIVGVFIFFYFCAPFLFSAMATHDYNSLYNGMQDAKRASGAYVEPKKSSYRSYSEDYAYGRKR